MGVRCAASTTPRPPSLKAPFARDDSHEKAPSSLEEGVGGGVAARSVALCLGTTPLRLGRVPLAKSRYPSSEEEGAGHAATFGCR